MTWKLSVMMMVVAGAFCSCKEKKPDTILDKDQMTSFMIEVYLAEARVSSTIFITDSARHVFGPHEKVLLQRRGIPDSVLRKSYAYYMEHPDEMQAILDAVIDSLSLREQAAGQAKPAP
ncbi:MAG TPA: DUF4296 domain-containing protein [Cyclobacteriaceae bacterium]|jgi:hypothetical protein|nr:DUF4296 domain-containing protein [Cyclobacteriaceae bacterium]